MIKKMNEREKLGKTSKSSTYKEEVDILYCRSNMGVTHRIFQKTLTKINENC